MSLVVLGKPLQFLIIRLLTSSALWHYYPHWCQLVYYPFLVKLAIAGFLWRRIISVNLMALETLVRNYLVELESDLLEMCVPVEDARAGAEDADAEDADAEDAEAEDVEEAEDEPADD